MHQIYNYDIYIFDCDGVILDSNQLKVDAMEKALFTVFNDNVGINNCVNYFKNNFGKSRFHHIDVFLSVYLSVAEQGKEKARKEVLSAFSLMCKELYLDAELTPGFIEFISSLQGKKFVASGSEQEELRGVFESRGLDKYFLEVFGSPTTKKDLLLNILQNHSHSKALMIGDSISDFEASKDNDIDFICYIPYSNVQSQMKSLSEFNKFEIITSWPLSAI
jgi:phosphoglycolate phosphatase-like HAD superfamily hydrolase